MILVYFSTIIEVDGKVKKQTTNAAFFDLLLLSAFVSYRSGGEGGASPKSELPRAQVQFQTIPVMNISKHTDHEMRRVARTKT